MRSRRKLPKTAYTRQKQVLFFLERVILPAERNGCWLWNGRLNDGGYGVFGRFPEKKAYRFSYELFIGPIPAGMEPDHTCHTPDNCQGGVTCIHRRCVNPWHMEPVTHKVNTLRGCAQVAINAKKTECPKGHPLSGANLKLDRYRSGRVARRCRVCANAAVAKSTAKKKESRRAS